MPRKENINKKEESLLAEDRVVRRSVSSQKPRTRVPRKPATIRRPEDVALAAKNRISSPGLPIKREAFDYRDSKKVRGGRNIFIIPVLILVIVILAGVLVIQNCDKCLDLVENGQGNNFENYQIPLGIQVNNEQAADPTAGWSVFEEKQKRFQFKYPAAWNVSESDGGISIATDLATTTVLIVADKTDKNLTDYLKDIDTKRKEQSEVKKEAPLTFGDSQGLLRQERLIGSQYDQVNAFLPVKEGILLISLTTPQITEEISNTYNLFLNNFQLNSDYQLLQAVNSTTTATTTTPQS